MTTSPSRTEGPHEAKAPLAVKHVARIRDELGGRRPDWSDFLAVRAYVIADLVKEGKTSQQIAHFLSMHAQQPALIHASCKVVTDAG